VNDLNNALLRDPALKLVFRPKNQLQIILGSIMVRTGQMMQAEVFIATICVIPITRNASKVPQ
jgi:phosphotransferase system IIB component